MSGISRWIGLACLMVIVVISAGVVWKKSGNPNALRHIVLDQCLPNQQQHQNPAPCAQVDVQKHSVIFKDRVGTLQYLLMPTYRINGIESPLLLDPRTPNFFWQAWQERGWMSRKAGKPIDDSVVSLAINSTFGRTQNHFHIHISCLRPAVRHQLDSQSTRISSRWLPLAGGINGNTYLARRVTESDLRQHSPFVMLAREVPGAREHMGRYGLALVAQKDGTFVLLATERNLWKLNRASAEEIQDHDCKIAQP